MFVTAFKKRNCYETITINDANGIAVVLAATDQIRIKVGRAGKAPILDLDSIAASGNGSTVARANPCTVRFDQNDLNFSPGTYDIEASVVDDSDGDAIKHADKGVLVLHNTQLGDVGLT